MLLGNSQITVDEVEVSITLPYKQFRAIKNLVVPYMNCLSEEAGAALKAGNTGVYQALKTEMADIEKAYSALILQSNKALFSFMSKEHKYE